MDFNALLNEDLRIAMLRGIEKGASYSMNDSMLHSYLCQIGHKCSRDQVRSQLQWLADQGLITLEVPYGVMVATMTERGLDVANARATVPGVKRPSPRS